MPSAYSINVNLNRDLTVKNGQISKHFLRVSISIGNSWYPQKVVTYLSVFIVRQRSLYIYRVVHTPASDRYERIIQISPKMNNKNNNLLAIEKMINIPYLFLGNIFLKWPFKYWSQALSVLIYKTLQIFLKQDYFEKTKKN